MEHSLEEKLAAIKMVEDGQSARSVSDKLSCCLSYKLIFGKKAIGGVMAEGCFN